MALVDKPRFLRTGWFLGIGLAGGLVLFASLYRLAAVPPPWWDEGWNLSVTRNWVEYGYYGQMLAGQPRPAGLSASFPVIAPLALSFRIFGVGLLQARLVGVIFTLGAFALLYFLASKLYGARIALLALFLMIFTPIADELHPILIGRQVLGEMPAIFYLLLGYTCLYLALQKSAWWSLPSMLAFGIAFTTKAQIPPFLIISLILPIVYAFWIRSLRNVAILGVALLGMWIVSMGLPEIQTLIIDRSPDLGSPTPGLFSVTAFVLNLDIRRTALGHVLAFGLPATLGLLFEVRRILRRNWDVLPDSPQAILRLSLLGLSGSWLFWYLTLGMFWVRYLFPPFFFGSIFAAVLVDKVTNGFDIKLIWARLLNSVMVGHPDRRSLPGFFAASGAMFVFIWMALATVATVLVLVAVFQNPVGDSAAATALFLDTQTEPDALIESYDSELFFLSDRRFHYPPDVVHVELIEREFFSSTDQVSYDPLAADPDYLVVGPFSRRYKLYDQVLAAGVLEKVAAFPGYDIYRLAGDK